ncbi:MAG: four helix bundle protein [Patescibacteria group bacterium]|jgi:four helix bundle protein
MNISKINSFQDLEAWQKGKELVIEIYNISKRFPKEETFGIISQLRRASLSAPANIAEGFARYHFRDKVRIYYIARGSLAEVHNYLILAVSLDYINEVESNTLICKCNQVGMLINGLIRSIDRQKI